MKLSGLTRRITRHDSVQAAISWLIAGYIRLAYFTTRWTFENWPQSRALIMAGEPLFVFLWHNRIAAMPLIWKQHPWRETAAARFSPSSSPITGTGAWCRGPWSTSRSNTYPFHPRKSSSPPRKTCCAPFVPGAPSA